MSDWDDLKFVLAVKRAGGLSGAARALGVNHSTVSRRIASAENRLGVRLFDRLPSGLMVTEEGQAAIEIAEDMERSFTRLQMGIASRDRALSGDVRITAPDVLIQCHMIKVFDGFIREYPDVNLSVLASNETLNLHQREADVAVRVSDAPDDSLFGRRVTGQRRALYASQDLVSEFPELLSECVSDVAPSYVTFSWWGGRAPAGFRKQFPNAKVTANFDDMASLYSAVRAGMGVSLLPCVIGESDDGLIRLEAHGFQKYRDIWVLTHADLKEVERIRLFMKYMASALERDRGVYMGS